MISSSSPLPVRLAALVAATCAIGLSAVAAAPAPAATPQLALGLAVSCVLQPDSTVKCWGDNLNGQLGNTTVVTTGFSSPSPTPTLVKKVFGPSVTTPTYIQISYGYKAGCGLLANGTVECWGDNRGGELGSPSSITYRASAIAVSGVSGVTKLQAQIETACGLLANTTLNCWTTTRGGNPYLGLSGVASLASGESQFHLCFAMNDGTAKCSGQNLSGQLGNGTTTNSATPVTVSGLTGVTQVSIGANHSCALLTGGTVKCWGSNTGGVLGDGTTTNRTSPVAVSDLTDVIQITAGTQFSCALLSGGTVKCWGNDANVVNSRTPTTISGLTGVTQIEASSYHMCALADGGLVVKCLGSNSAGQLGTSQTATPTSSTPVTALTWTKPTVNLSGVPSSPTKQTSASIGFTSTPTGATFQCSIDGGAYASCTSPKSLTGLADGTHSIAVKASKDGLESDVASASWVVDNTAPAAPGLSGVPSSLTDATHAVIHFHSDGAGVTYECSVDGGTWTVCTSPLELSGLGDGSHSVSVRATDAAGNTSTVSSASWTVDTTAHTPPYVALISPDVSPTKQTTASIEYDGEEGATFLCSLDGGAYEPCPPAPVLLTGLADGSHTLSVKQLDGAGNPSEPSSVTWTVDTTPPVAPIVTSRPSATTTSTSATIGFTGTGDPGASFECKVDSGDWGPCPSNPFTLNPVSVGAHTVLVREVDAAGNSGAASTIAWTVQSVTPAACSPLPTPPTPTRTVTATRVRGNLWSMNAGAVFNTGGDVRACAQFLTVQVSTAANKPSSSVPRPLAPNYANGILAWTGASVERASVAKPRWMRVENRVGRWSGWIAVK